MHPISRTPTSPRTRSLIDSDPFHQNNQINQTPESTHPASNLAARFKHTQIAKIKDQSNSDHREANGHPLTG